MKSLARTPGSRWALVLLILYVAVLTTLFWAANAVSAGSGEADWPSPPSLTRSLPEARDVTRLPQPGCAAGHTTDPGTPAARTPGGMEGSTCAS